MAQIEGTVTDLAGLPEMLRKQVASHGWSAVHLVDYPTPQGPVSFSHTVGLGEKFNSPEIVMVSIPAGICTMFLQEVVTRLTQGERFRDWMRCPGFLDVVPVWFRLLDMEATDLVPEMALKLYPQSRFLQMVLPDLEGRYPWDDGCHDISSAQTFGVAYRSLN